MVVLETYCAQKKILTLIVPSIEAVAHMEQSPTVDQSNVTTGALWPPTAIWGFAWHAGSKREKEEIKCFVFTNQTYQTLKHKVKIELTRIDSVEKSATHLAREAELLVGIEGEKAAFWRVNLDGTIRNAKLTIGDK